MAPERVHEFRAKLTSVGQNRCVEVPASVSRALGADARIAVRGEVEGVAMRSTLVPSGAGRHRLFVNSRIWRPLGIDRGDVVRVSLSADRASREPEVPADIEAAFTRGEASDAWDALTPSGRRQFVRWIGEAKGADTRAARIKIGAQRLIDNTHHGRSRSAE